MGGFWEFRNPDAAVVLPTELNVAPLRSRMLELARPRLAFLAECDSAWWLTRVRFFDAERQRIWIFWAQGAAHGPSPNAVDGVSAAAGQASAGNVRADGGCHVGGGGSNAGRGSGAAEDS